MNIQERIKKLFKGKRGVNVAIFVGLAGIIIIFLSDYFPTDNSSEPDASQFSVTEYADYLEEKLERIVSKIDGAGKCNIAVTLAASEEYIYVYDNNKSTETEQSENGYSEKNSNEKSYSKIINDAGDEALVTTAVLTPSINGVVVVCDGGEDEAVKTAVRDAIAAVLNISKDKIYITQRKR